MSEKIGLFLFCTSSSEFRTGDGGGNGNVETLGTLPLMEVRNEQPMGNVLAHSLGDAVPFIAHDNDTFLCQWLAIYIIAIEQSAVDREIVWQRGKELQ